MSLTTRLRGSVIQTILGEGTVRLERTLLGPRGRIAFFYQVDDPYSHLLSQVIGALAEAAELDVEFLLVPPPTEDFDPEPELRAAYAIEDAKLLATEYGLNMPRGAVPPSAELVAKANGILALDRPWRRQLEVAQRVAEALWSGETIAESAGDAAPIMAANHTRRHRRQHYLGGMLRYRGVWYWGIDRLRHLRTHLAAEGRPVPEVLVAKPVSRIQADEMEMFFSFRSPYAYVGAVRAQALCEKRGMRLVIRPVLPAVMRGLVVPRAKRIYIARDTAREARHFGVAFGKVCDPLGPGIARCLAAFQAAREEGKEAELVVQVGRGIWAEARDVATDRDLRMLVERAGVSWAAVRDRVEREDWKDEVEANRRVLYDRGMWGVPSFSVGDFHAWGNDRLDMIERRLDGSDADMVDDALSAP